MSRRKLHHRKRRSIQIALAAAAGLIVIALLAAGGVWLSRELSYQEPVPAGTPNQNPVVDQKPVSTPSRTSAPSSSSSDAAGTEQSSSAAESESASSAVSSSQPEAAETVGSEQVLRGVIADATTSQITVIADGNTISFWRETAEVTGRLVEGATVDIFYTGTLEGTDASQAYVTRIVSYM